jgi:hypothetical protein
MSWLPGRVLGALESLLLHRSFRGGKKRLSNGFSEFGNLHSSHTRFASSEVAGGGNSANRPSGLALGSAECVVRTPCIPAKRLLALVSNPSLCHLATVVK